MRLERLVTAKWLPRAVSLSVLGAALLWRLARMTVTLAVPCDTLVVRARCRPLRRLACMTVTLAVPCDTLVVRAWCRPLRRLARMTSHLVYLVTLSLSVLGAALSGTTHA